MNCFRCFPLLAVLSIPLDLIDLVCVFIYIFNMYILFLYFRIPLFPAFNPLVCFVECASSSRSMPPCGVCLPCARVCLPSSFLESCPHSVTVPNQRVIRRRIWNPVISLLFRSRHPLRPFPVLSVSSRTRARKLILQLPCPSPPEFPTPSCARPFYSTLRVSEVHSV